MKINRRVRLSDLRPISQQEFDTACHVCEEIRKIEELRDSYIEEHGLDPDIALPGGNWAKDGPNPIHDLYRIVVTPTYDVINRLRLYTQPFTGYTLASFSVGAMKEAILHPIPGNFDEEIEKIAPQPDHWVYRYITITRHVPKDVIALPPKILGEIGWDIDGSPVNHDTWLYQERLNLLYEAGIIDWLRKKIKVSGGVNILEIGAGYGGLAYYLKHIIPQTNYYICEIPESLLFCSLYLAIACPEYQYTIYNGTDKSILYQSGFGFKFIPNFMFDDLIAANIKIDLAINTWSFSEMSEKQMRYYAQNLSYMLGHTGILFEQNYDCRQGGFIYSKLYLPEYFMFRRAIAPVLFGKLDGTHVWANRRISDILRPTVKRQILRSIRHLRSKWWLLWKIQRVIGKTRFDTLEEFVNSKPWLKSLVLRILGARAYFK